MWNTRVSKLYFALFLVIEGEVKYLGPGVTGILPRISVRGSPLEGQQDLSSGTGVKHRVPFGNWDVHEFRWTAGSS